MVYSIILFAGKSTRFKNKSDNKIFSKIKNQPLYYFTLNQCLQIKEIKHTILVVNKTNLSKISKLISKNNCSIIEGSSSNRFESLKKGINFLNKKFIVNQNDTILTFDGDRPLVSKDLILKHIQKCEQVGFTTTILPVYDSIFNFKNFSYIKRDNLSLVQTPQSFKFKYWKTTYNKSGTDLFTCLNLKLASKNLINGELKNWKITTSNDLKNIQDFK